MAYILAFIVGLVAYDTVDRIFEAVRARRAARHGVGFYELGGEE